MQVSSLRSMKKQEKRTAWLFLMPALIGFIAFMLIPILFSVLLSFSKWDLLSGVGNIKLIGFSNYVKLVGDESFKRAIVNNVLISVVTVSSTSVIALALANALNQKILGRGLIRTMVFIPYICILPAICAVFMALFNRDFGPINNLLYSMGISNPPGWLVDPQWALPSIMILWIWRFLGYFVLIYLAGLQSISKTYYEAAQLDGCSSLKEFIHITLPMISPTTFFLVITGFIASFQIFPEIEIMTKGGPGNATYTLLYSLYTNGFKYLKMGYANAIAMIYFLIVITITLVQWRLQKKWVHY